MAPEACTWVCHNAEEPDECLSISYISLKTINGRSRKSRRRAQKEWGVGGMVGKKSTNTKQHLLEKKTFFLGQTVNPTNYTQ